MKNLEGKVAIVTGAARGIGAAIAKRLAADGAAVAVCDLNAEWCEETVKEIEAAGGKAKGYGVNVAVSAEVDECVKSVIADLGGVHIMVNNAGITKDGLLMRMSDDDWDAVINVNLKGTFLFTRAVSRPMIICPSPPMLMMPLRYATQMPAPTIVRGVMMLITPEMFLNEVKG